MGVVTQSKKKMSSDDDSSSSSSDNESIAEDESCCYQTINGRLTFTDYISNLEEITSFRYGTEQIIFQNRGLIDTEVDRLMGLLRTSITTIIMNNSSWTLYDHCLTRTPPKIIDYISLGYLKKLEITHSHITDDGVRDLLPLIHLLEELSLYLNNLTDVTMLAVAKILPTRHDMKLKRLDLSLQRNEGVQYDTNLQLLLAYQQSSVDSVVFPHSVHYSDLPNENMFTRETPQGRLLIKRMATTKKIKNSKWYRIIMVLCSIRSIPRFNILHRTNNIFVLELIRMIGNVLLIKEECQRHHENIFGENEADNESHYLSDSSDTSSEDSNIHLLGANTPEQIYDSDEE